MIPLFVGTYPQKYWNILFKVIASILEACSQWDILKTMSEYFFINIRHDLICIYNYTLWIEANQSKCDLLTPMAESLPTLLWRSIINNIGYSTCGTTMCFPHWENLEKMLSFSQKIILKNDMFLLMIIVF